MMKHQSAIIWILFAACFVSCQKDPNTPYDDIKDKSRGSITATINGKPWVSNFASIGSNEKDGKYNLSGTLFIDGIDRQSLSFVNIAIDENIRQPLYPWYDSSGHSIAAAHDSSNGAFYLSNDDVLETSYLFLHGTEDNYVMINDFDAAKKQLKGSFQLTVFTTDDPTQGFADTLRITNGNFDLTIP